MMTQYEAAMETVCMAFEITPELLKKQDRTARLVETRMWFAWLINKSSTSIGRMIDRDHATILYYRSSIREMMKLYPIYREKAAVLRKLYDARIKGMNEGTSRQRISRQRKYVNDLTAALYAAIHELYVMTNGDVTELCVLYKDDIDSIHASFQRIYDMASSQRTMNGVLMTQTHTLDEIAVKAHESMEFMNILLRDNLK